MSLSRRRFFALAGTGTANAVLISALETFYTNKSVAVSRYGDLLTDSQGIIDLPPGFKYRRLSETGQLMNDGYKVPGAHDGMGAFLGRNNTTVLIRNHELGGSSPYIGRSIPKKYDVTGLGGTTTLVIDNQSRTLLKHYRSLAGTYRNCAGGITPWGSWLSCEESIEVGEKKHGYIFEVPSKATGLVDPIPLRAMGRFNHEAAAVDPRTGYVYMTEDRGDSCFYRFVPKIPGKLSEGGHLAALAIDGLPQVNTKSGFPLKQPTKVRWIRITTPDPETDTVRVEAFNKGAAQFVRGEGMFYHKGYIYFCCTSGGTSSDGQIWRYNTFRNTIEKYIEPNNSAILDNPDNIVIAPNGDLFLCEDGGDGNSIVGVTPTRELYRFARNSLNASEFAGICFSSDGKTMFVNMQNPGITFAIWGDW